jgi:tRNA pseudouridine32 synthase / 23S rRNA pseudouridine746 synthase
MCTFAFFYQRKMQVPKQDHFTRFTHSIANYPLPERFTFPFYYRPNPLSTLAAKELQAYLETQTDWEHNFGIEAGKEGMEIGKMFGVLVVQNQQNEIGYLSAFSGKLAGQNHHARFVPPVFDILEEDGFFRRGEMVVTAINSRIEALESDPEFVAQTQFLEAEKALAQTLLSLEKQKVKDGKNDRKKRRQIAESTLEPAQLEATLQEMVIESLKDQYYYRQLDNYWKQRLQHTQDKIDVFAHEIAALKEERKVKSSALQQDIFDQYYFLNQQGEKKSLGAIFQHTEELKPPAGAGECAAPKLLQYAFLHQLKPITMAEFWWGRSPKAEVRKHGQFYPACRGKCEPILSHMLEGIEMDDNPMMSNSAIGRFIETIYEDDALLVINKPAELLSVPGKNVEDSVYYRMKQRFPDASGPLIVHRLDMSTSGLMLIAKTKEVHKILQSQFINRRIKKRYVALLDGIVEAESGTIDLPIRVDLDDRPRQLVCYQYGKNAQTEWQVVERIGSKTKVYFHPITGRTHQLRLHAAHPMGLNTPIVGDDLYGNKASRLHLHAEMIEFIHPESKEWMVVQVDAAF